MNEHPSELGSVSRAILACGGADDGAAQAIWDRFFERLCRYVKQRIYPRHRRHFDEEDVATSAFHALFQGLKSGQFTHVRRRDELWLMLTLIAARKASNAAKQADRKKRGGGRVRGDSAFAAGGIDRVVSYAQRNDESSLAGVGAAADDLLARLPDESLRRIALLRLSGHRVEDIARQLNCVSRTVERKLQLIRKLWGGGYSE
jgi:DNA-directed RNA polymerase specialized sigma24 family protein